MKAPKVYSQVWRPDWIRREEDPEKLDPNYENMYLVCGTCILQDETDIQKSLWYRFESKPLMLPLTEQKIAEIHLAAIELAQDQNNCGFVTNAPKIHRLNV